MSLVLKKGATKKLKDRTGQRFGNLVVLSRHSQIDKSHFKWNCKCDCGNTTVVICSNLRSGNTKSCGCMMGRLREYKKRAKAVKPKTLYWDKEDKSDFVPA